jgi:AcrR family transcriptional regulator
MQDRSKRTRELLLNAAYRVFVRDGFERAQLESIAREAGRTKGAVYAHFESKEHLFLSLLEQRTIETERRVDALIARESEPERFVETLRVALTELSDPDWAILNLELKLYAIRHPSAKVRLRSAYRRFHELETKTKIFERLTRGSQSSMTTSKLLALWTLVSAVVLDMNFDPEFMTRREAKLILSEVFDGLFPQDGKPDRNLPAKHKNLSADSAGKDNRRSPKLR